METRRLIEERARLYEELDALLRQAESEGRELTPEEAERADQLEARLRQIVEQYERRLRLAELVKGYEPPDHSAGRPVDPEEEYRSAFVAWLRGSASAEQLALLNERRAEIRQLLTFGAGSYLVPERTAREIITTLDTYGAVRRAAQVVTTDGGEPVAFPVSDDAGAEGYLVAEGATVPNVDVPLQAKLLAAHTYVSGIQLVSQQLLSDSAFDIEAFLRERFAERLGRITGRHYLLGTGVGQPEGVLAGLSAAREVPGSTLNYDALVDLVHAVDPAYRDPQDAVFILNDSTLAAIRKLKDSQGRPLWQPEVSGGAPGTILGYRYFVDNAVPDKASNVRYLLFGNLRRGYIIRDVRGVGVVRMNERYADRLMVGFMAWLRTDGRIVDERALAVLKG